MILPAWSVTEAQDDHIMDEVKRGDLVLGDGSIPTGGCIGVATGLGITDALIVLTGQIANLPEQSRNQPANLGSIP